MPVFQLEPALIFPPVHLSEPDGLLAVGGDLSVERLKLAYQQGIFPWYEGEEILWWCPDPRFIMIPSELKISKSMKALLRKEPFEFTVNRSFNEVIRACKSMDRKNQDGTWIGTDIEQAYIRLHEQGLAHSAEVWQNHELVGGLYGIRMGKVFFGESMFSRKANASKYAFIRYIQLLMAEGVELIDCQVYTEHLESLGAKMIPREEFINRINQLTQGSAQ